MLQHLNEVVKTKLSTKAIEKRPGIPLVELSQPGALEKFFETFEWFIEEIEKAEGSPSLEES